VAKVNIREIPVGKGEIDKAMPGLSWKRTLLRVTHESVYQYAFRTGDPRWPLDRFLAYRQVDSSGNADVIEFDRRGRAYRVDPNTGERVLILPRDNHS
jgi:hypothetical protein